MFDSPVMSRRLGCGGTLISDRHVITDIGCVDFDSHPDYVLLGDTVVGLDENIIKVIQVKRYILHDDTSINITVLEMVEPVQLDKYPNIKPVCLPNLGADFTDFEGIVTGWAYGGVNGYYSWLHETNVTVTDQGDESQIRGKTHGGKTLCYGDTGGPLVVSDPANNNGLTLAGVINDNGCDTVQTFINVSQFITWINSIISDAATCPPPP